ncbi:protoporphyrinogen oxidase [Paractinoplanes abujensis]|uniref:Coproporphyrinogen III oxidase n=1 Tax=Paractinoplanes abujensis TaxID=882441 RepID=A0A7W7G808_9ACTN|nr:protoporphyrinogen oxidase [Actinoplanes abujensis]MBB4697496.1 oxygen-dependent protoporphyrinogen oxidase [Actinoplanes abujensis]GID18029.1 protoporphyrinogen oxidase [Actinoplanes abujensis]
MRKRVAVIGGGIAGLAAAVRLRDLTPPDTEIIVYEQSGALGGKLRTGELAGVTVERGAESFLMTGSDGAESAAVGLVKRLGLERALVHPQRVPAALALGGRLAPMPAGTLVGVPSDPATLGDLARAEAGHDADGGRPLLAEGQDVAVGVLVRERYGPEVVDRLVDPMLGGVYAGRADRLSLEVTMPQLAATARVEHTLSGAVRAAQAASKRVPGQPVFGALEGGLSRLVGAAATASGARISMGLPVREIARTPHGWRLLLGPVAAPPGFSPSPEAASPDLSALSARAGSGADRAPAGSGSPPSRELVDDGWAPQTDDVDAVVLAVPARPSARLLTRVAPDAAAAIGELNYASVALVALALPPGTELPALSGFLVPPSEGTLVKAATFVTRKWARPEGSPVIVRVSLGRAGEEERLQFDDAVLTERAHRELGDLLGVALPAPVATWVQRWGGGLPQYTPGHRERLAAARAGLPPGLALAGAAFDGVGIPACVASGERAAEDVCKAMEDAA